MLSYEEDLQYILDSFDFMPEEEEKRQAVLEAILAMIWVS